MNKLLNQEAWLWTFRMLSRTLSNSLVQALLSLLQESRFLKHQISTLQLTRNQKMKRTLKILKRKRNLNQK